jgi:putative NADH-flavin reductase
VKLLVIGATGAIGRVVVDAALRAGHEVTAFARSSEKLATLPGGVHGIVGDVADRSRVAEAVHGQDAVISALGSSPDPAQLDVPATAARNVLAAMQLHGVRRFVGLAGAATQVEGERKPIGGRITSALVRLLARNVVAAKQREYDVVRASDADWTMVRPPRVTDGPRTGRVEIDDKLHGFRISRDDLAFAMVELATSAAWIGRAPYVSARRR